MRRQIMPGFGLILGLFMACLGLIVPLPLAGLDQRQEAPRARGSRAQLAAVAA